MVNLQRLLTVQQVCALVSRCRSSIYSDIHKGQFPAPVKIGPRASRWRAEDIAEWMGNLPVADFCTGGQP